MVSPGRSLGFFLLTLLCMPAFALEVIRYGSQEVICSQGLSECTVKDTSAIRVKPKNGAVEVRDLKVQAALCCQDGAQCSLCLAIHTQLYIQPNKDEEEEDEGNSGADEEDSERTRGQSGSVTVCYAAASMLPACKRVVFTVNSAVLAQTNEAQLSLVVFKPVGVAFGSSVSVSVHSTTQPLYREAVVPSIDTVCSSDLQERIEECDVPRLTSRIDLERNQVELQVVGKKKSQVTLLCLQYEGNGKCQALERMTVPLYSVTPCMCLQAWWDEGDQRSHRSAVCPFMNHTGVFQKNVWRNVSLSVEQGQMNSGGAMLLWNLSAPCRLEGEVWPCHRAAGVERDMCKEIKGYRQQLSNSTWRQNSKGRWELPGAFEEIDLLLSPCVMGKVKGMENKLGPFCTNDISRWRWSVLVIAVVLLVCLTVLTFYLLRNISSIKQWAWTWRYSECVQTAGRGHVVLLSPPDAEDGVVSELMCGLGSLLCDRGLAVSVDLWSRAELCSLGPLPWLYSQLLRVDGLGGRAVLVLTRKALERTEEWSGQFKKTQVEGSGGLPRVFSPYSDVFSASLYCIKADQQLGRAGKRFVLVNFESHHPAKQPPYGDRGLPELLRGLPLFRLPSQTQALLSELGVGGKVMGADGRRRTEGLKGGFI